MKIKQTVTISQDEIGKLLSKFIEKKLQKKVVKFDFETLSFTLEDSDITDEPTTPAVK